MIGREGTGYHANTATTLDVVLVNVAVELIDVLTHEADDGACGMLSWVRDWRRDIGEDIGQERSRTIFEKV